MTARCRATRFELATRAGNYACRYTAAAPGLFGALVWLRRQLEPDGLTVAVQGARRDTCPSGMARDRGAGMKACMLVPGQAQGLPRGSGGRGR
jgi:hypothetical protein